jgi:hypothetical protein
MTNERIIQLDGDKVLTNEGRIFQWIYYDSKR